MAHEAFIHSYEYTYTVLIEPHANGGFSVTCPALPNLIVYAETLPQARQRAAEAIERYLQWRSAQGRTIPVDAQPQARREPITVRFSYAL
jgi:antitoxin HicB